MELIFNPQLLSNDMRAIGQPLTDIEREQFIAAARSLMHVRWRHQGRNKQGVDCAGLVVYSLRSIKRSVMDLQGYGRLPYRGALEAMMKENLGEPLLASQLQIGDVPLMKFQDTSAPCHCGIVTAYPFGGFALIHAFAQNREVVEHRLDDEWKAYITEVYRP